MPVHGILVELFLQKAKWPHGEIENLFTRPDPYGRRQYYSYKRLILAWQIELREIYN
jgi:hypothetical protein